MKTLKDIKFSYYWGKAEKEQDPIKKKKYAAKVKRILYGEKRS